MNNDPDTNIQGTSTVAMADQNGEAAKGAHRTPTDIDKNKSAHQDWPPGMRVQS